MFMLNLNSSLSDDDHVRFNLKQNYKPYNTTQSNTRLLSRNVGVSLVSIARLPSGSVSTGTGLSAQRAVHVESLTVSGTATAEYPWPVAVSVFCIRESDQPPGKSAAAGTRGAGALPPPPSPRRPAASTPPHDEADTAGRASSFDARQADRAQTPAAHPSSGSAAAAAADAGGVAASLAAADRAAQLTAEKAVRDLLMSDDDSDSESDVYDDVVDRTITPAGEDDRASSTPSPADRGRDATPPSPSGR